MKENCWRILNGNILRMERKKQRGNTGMGRKMDCTAPGMNMGRKNQKKRTGMVNGTVYTSVGMKMANRSQGVCIPLREKMGYGIYGIQQDS